MDGSSLVGAGTAPAGAASAPTASRRAAIGGSTLFAESRDRSEVTNDAVVTEVTAQLPAHGAPLRLERIVKVYTAPISETLERSSEAVLG
jgi:hypothetical protein